MLSEGSEMSSHCKLLGRKKGYSSTKQGKYILMKSVRKK